MAVVFQPDPLVSGLNSFASVSYADDYFAKRLHDTSWTSAVQGTKESVLMWASSQLSLLNWKGVPTSGSQVLAFPRKGLTYTVYYEPITNSPIELYDAFGYVSSTRTVADTEIPWEIKDATCELALSLIDKDVTLTPGVVGFKSVKVDTIALEVEKGAKFPWLSPTIRNMCSRFLVNTTPYGFPVTRVG